LLLIEVEGFIGRFLSARVLLVPTCKQQTRPDASGTKTPALVLFEAPFLVNPRKFVEAKNVSHAAASLPVPETPSKAYQLQQVAFAVTLVGVNNPTPAISCPRARRRGHAK